MKKLDKEKKRRYTIAFLSYLLVVAGGVCGIITSRYFSDEVKPVLNHIVWCCILITAVMFLFAHIAKKHFTKRRKKTTIEENDRFYLSLLESAEKISAKELALIKLIRRISYVCTVALGAFAFAISFAAGVNCGGLFLLALAISAFTLSLTGAIAIGSLYFSVVLGLSLSSNAGFANNFLLYLLFAVIALIPARASLMRKRFGKPDKDFAERKSVLSETEYPLLYSIAEKASEATGYKGTFRLALDNDCGVKIVKINDMYMVFIGIIFLSQVSEDELYNVFLHEFAHCSDESSIPEVEFKYALFINSIPKSFFNTALIFLDTAYYYHYNLFYFISSQRMERSADEAMIKYGNASSAASFLLKISYYYYYSWESTNVDYESIYSLEKPDNLFFKKSIKLFEDSLKQRKDEWNKLIKREISLPGETHPLLKTRIEALGISEYTILQRNPSERYLKEYSQALLLAEDITYRNRLVNYEKNRKALFLDPKSKIESWEAGGKPIYTHNYAEISYYFRLLGRISDANSILNTAIQTLSEKEAAYATLLTGYRMLHEYDETGIEYVYRAIGLNRMYAAEGLEEIKMFCRYSGNEAELNKYLTESAKILQRNIDIDKELKILRKKDRISAERLPAKMSENLLNIAVSAGCGKVKNIYVVRKTISDDLFTTAIVVRFAPQTDVYTQALVISSLRSFLEVFKDRQFNVFRYQHVAKAKIENIDSSCIYVSR